MPAERPSKWVKPAAPDADSHCPSTNHGWCFASPAHGPVHAPCCACARTKQLGTPAQASLQAAAVPVACIPSSSIPQIWRPVLQRSRGQCNEQTSIICVQYGTRGAAVAAGPVCRRLRSPFDTARAASWLAGAMSVTLSPAPGRRRWPTRTWGRGGGRGQKGDVDGRRPGR